jgi:hypothetical protein
MALDALIPEIARPFDLRSGNYFRVAKVVACASAILIYALTL